MTVRQEYRIPIIAGATGLLFLIASYSQWHFRPSVNVGTEILDTLKTLGHKALDDNDVPVAAVILYAGEIIGVGRNTVQRDRSAGGHAEIEAISDAFRRIGSIDLPHTIETLLSLYRHSSRASCAAAPYWTTTLRRRHS